MIPLDIGVRSASASRFSRALLHSKIIRHEDRPLHSLREHAETYARCWKEWTSYFFLEGTMTLLTIKFKLCAMHDRWSPRPVAWTALTMLEALSDVIERIFSLILKKVTSLLMNLANRPASWRPSITRKPKVREISLNFLSKKCAVTLMKWRWRTLFHVSVVNAMSDTCVKTLRTARRCSIYFSRRRRRTVVRWRGL